MSFALYLVGTIVLIAGLGLGAYYLHVPPKWIAVMAIIIAGAGIMAGVTRTRRPDRPS
jgi:hypothetical protein